MGFNMFSSRSISALKVKIETVLHYGRINLALREIHDFVERIITEPVCTAQVFASRDLDQLCLRIGRDNLAKLSVLQDDLALDSIENVTVVYLVSRLQRSGGHSRLVHDFISAQPEKDHLILSTEVGGPSDKDFLQLFSEVENVRFVYSPGGNFEARLSWLQSTLLSSRASHVFLFNHHQDSVAVAALVPELGIKGSFCHHGDHHICLGVHLGHLAHIDFHPMGYHHCRDELGIDNIFIPLTIEDKGARIAGQPFLRDGVLTTCTAARSNKIEIPYFVNYLDMVPKLLKATNGKHVHIGRLTPWALFRIRRGLRRLGIPADRFVYIPWVPSVWTALHEHHVDMYIASFPYGGGLTLIEAMGAGVPVVLHRHIFSRVLSGIDIGYPGVFSWREPPELLDICSKVTAEKLQQHSLLARKQYMQYHRHQLLAEALLAADGKGIVPPGLSNGFRPQRDEFAAWLESQVSIGHLLRRSAYRFIRKLRNNV